MKGLQSRGISTGKGLVAGGKEPGTCGELNGHQCGGRMLHEAQGTETEKGLRGGLGAGQIRP